MFHKEGRLAVLNFVMFAIPDKVRVGAVQLFTKIAPFKKVQLFNQQKPCKVKEIERTIDRSAPVDAMNHGAELVALALSAWSPRAGRLQTGHSEPPLAANTRPKFNRCSVHQCIIDTSNPCKRMSGPRILQWTVVCQDIAQKQ